MSNYYAPCFYRIDSVVIPSYIELPCFQQLSTIFESFVELFKINSLGNCYVTFSSEFLHTEVRFTDQSSKPPGNKEDRIT